MIYLIIQSPNTSNTITNVTVPSTTVVQVLLGVLNGPQELLVAANVVFQRGGGALHHRLCHVLHDGQQKCLLRVGLDEVGQGQGRVISFDDADYELIGRRKKCRFKQDNAKELDEC